MEKHHSHITNVKTKKKILAISEWKRIPFFQGKYNVNGSTVLSRNYKAHDIF